MLVPEVDAVTVFEPVVVNEKVVLARPELAVTVLLARPVAEKVTGHLLADDGATTPPSAALAPVTEKVIDTVVRAEAAEAVMFSAVPGGYA